ncbi:GPW/gp25 family protein [Cytophagaceae bacterium ABcell3]|nr:GPW/gp25 family protein [Cytophagaceae bacterium ABcell3]
MNTEYYKIPLDFNRIFENKELKKCDIGEAISQNLQLIIVSHNGEHRHNPSFGCEIWEMDFDLIMNLRTWEEKLRKSLLNAISENEKKLEHVEVEVKVSEVEKKFIKDKYAAIKRQVDIFVYAVLVETGEKYHFHTQLYLSPISYN